MSCQFFISFVTMGSRKNHTNKAILISHFPIPGKNSPQRTHCKGKRRRGQTAANLANCPITCEESILFLQKRMKLGRDHTLSLVTWWAWLSFLLRLFVFLVVSEPPIPEGFTPHIPPGRAATLLSFGEAGLSLSCVDGNNADKGLGNLFGRRIFLSLGENNEQRV